MTPGDLKLPKAFRRRCSTVHRLHIIQYVDGQSRHTSNSHVVAKRAEQQKKMDPGTPLEKN